jgi:pyruvate dehydrogenase E1 component beta subunit
MAVMNMVKALNSAIDIMLEEDEKVLVFGEDAGKEGGVFRVTEGLQEKYGEKRVFDAPLAESAIVGAGLGMCIGGLRPVVEIQFSGFMYPAFNQLITHVSRYRNRTRGRFQAPMVMRMPYGGMVKALELHSESMEALYAHIPGLKVVIPSTPYDAKGLLISAIEDNDPVMFLEPKRSYRAVKQEVPDGKYRIKIGKARIAHEGSDITLVAYGAMMKIAQQAVAMAKKQGISVELIDLRTIYPMDTDTVMESVKKTGRLLVTHEGPQSFGVAAELLAQAHEEAFLYLEAPPTRVTGFDTIVPLPKTEDLYYPNPERIFLEIKRLVEF